MTLEKSKIAYERAKALIPGGVNSPVRALGAVGGIPFFAHHGKGSYIYDIDGNSYIDYILGYGPLILGHLNENVVQALNKTIGKGLCYGAPTQQESELVELIKEFFPSIELLRLVNSGTEATMSAIRLARGFTMRRKIIKFDGCYHGHADYLLVKAGSGAQTFSIPDSGGVPPEFSSLTITLPFNDGQRVKDIFKNEGKNIACVIVEPVAGNMGVVLPENGFLETLREETRKYGSLLIFDEVMSGFRVSKGGAVKKYGIVPDLICLGKVIGGGLPIGAYGGKEEIMKNLAPYGNIYQAGTLSGNPLSVSSGIATLKELKKNKFFENIEEKTENLCKGLDGVAKEKGIPVKIHRSGSMWTLFFTSGEINNIEDVKKCDLNRFSKFFHSMRENGISLPPSQFEACFMSISHSDDDIEKTIQSAKRAFNNL